MKINQHNYVDEAEKVIKGIMSMDKQGKMKMTTSKIRNLLAMTAELKTDVQHSREDTLNADIQSRVQYLKMRIAYEAGREKAVKNFVEKASLLACISEVGQKKENLLLFCNYMEALTAYHKYYIEE